MCCLGKGSHLQRSSGTHALGILEEQQLLTEVSCGLWARTGQYACRGALLCHGLCDCWVAYDVHEPIQASLQGLLQELNEFMSKNESRPREGAYVWHECVPWGPPLLSHALELGKPQSANLLLSCQTCTKPQPAAYTLAFNRRAHASAVAVRCWANV
jgi:hypothetical protein